MSGIVRLLINSDTGIEEVEVTSMDFYIGRSSKSDVTINNELLSRKHIQVKVIDGKLEIKDLGTTNGTSINNDKLNPQQWYRVINDDEIRIGNGNILINIEAIIHNEEESTKVLNLNDFKELENTKTERIKIKANNKSKDKRTNLIKTNIYSNSSSAAVKYQSEIEEESFAPHIESGVREILNKVENDEGTQFSEVELLEIKKIEIEAQVVALKIKEESELQAKRLLDKAHYEVEESIEKAENKANDIVGTATYKANDLLGGANQKAEQLVHEASLKAEELLSQATSKADHLINSALTDSEKFLSDAKKESDKLLKDANENSNRIKNETNEHCNRIKGETERKLESVTTNIEESEQKRESLRSKVDELSQKVSDSLEEKKNLELKNDDLKQKIIQDENKIEELEQKNFKILDEFHQNKAELFDSIDVLNNKYNDVNTELEERQAILSEVESKRVDLENNIFDLKETETKIQDKNDKLNNENIGLVNLIEKSKTEAEELLQNKDEILLEIKTSEEENLRLSIVTKEKESFLQNIEKKSQDYYNTKKEEYNLKLNKIQKEDEAQATDLKEQSIKRANNIVEKAEQKANSLEEQAKELYEIAKEKEKEAVLFDDQTRLESKKQAEKVNEQLLKKLHSANNEAKEITDKALGEYEHILVRAKENAEKTVEKAKEEAREYFVASKHELEKAQEKAIEIVSIAQDKSVQLHNDGLKELEQLKVKLSSENKDLVHLNKTLNSEIVKAQSDVKNIKNTISIQTEEFQKQMATERTSIIEDANKNASKIMQEAENELLNAKGTVQKMQKIKMAEAESIISKRNEEEKKRYEAQLTQERESLAKLRAQEMENIKNKKVKEEKEFQTRKEQYVHTVALGIENLVNGKLNEIVVNKMSRSETKVELDKIQYLVKASLLDENPENNQLLKKLNPYGKLGIGKSTKLMKRFIIAGAVLACLGVIHLAFPGFYSSLTDGINSAVSVDESAKDLYLKDLQEKRDSKPRFNPRKTDSFKKSYTDNILYTNSYADMWLTDKLQKDWTVKVDQMIVFKLKLKDYKVIKYISEEFKLIRALKQMSTKIKLNTEKEQIQEMRDFEAKGIKKLKEILKNQRNLNRMHSVKKKFFIDFRNKNNN